MVVIGGVEILDFDDCEWVVLLKSSAGSSSIITSVIVNESDKKQIVLESNSRTNTTARWISRCRTVCSHSFDGLYEAYLPDLFGFALELDLVISKPGDGDGFDGTELFSCAGDACVALFV